MEVQVHIECPYDLSVELAESTGPTAAPIHRESIADDLGELIEESFVRGVLADRLPADPAKLHVVIEPVWLEEPLVDCIQILVTTEQPGSVGGYACTFRHGRWSRRMIGVAQSLRQEGSIPEGRQAFARLIAIRNGEGPAWGPPPLHPLTVADTTLDELGVRSIEETVLTPDRPVLLNGRMVDDILACTRAAGTSESGGGTLGRVARLPEPLPGTRTRLVTVLSNSLTDERHEGAPGRFTFNPAALAEAAHFADLRGQGENVVTAFHTHGWGAGCDECNTNERCLLPQCTTISVDDYVVLESLFPSKATLMPIAGRKLGAPGRDPVLEVHAWRGGRMRPVRWARYID